MDAGQGVFINVSYKNYNLIFDCGSTSNSNLGNYMVVPYLIKNGINTVDGVFISHWDEDHYSGLTELIKSNIDVKRIFSSYDFIDDTLLNDNISKKKNIENVINLNGILNSDITVLKKDDNVKINENLSIGILWPEDEYSAENKNNSSLVVMLYYKGRKILIPGDIERDVENIIYEDLSKSDILIVPHHGSKTSSTDNFVEAVSPNIVVFSYGKNNYGIPSNEVIERYENINSNILTTFDQGEIKFILKDEKLYYNNYKGEKSYNYYELYFDWIIIKILVFGFFIGLIFVYRN
jgi:competence protein ComEC